MSSEVCPFCGKTYKRLKSHLPHCRAAASAKTPPTKHDIAAGQTSSQLTAASSKAAAKGKKSTRPETTGLQAEKGGDVSASSTPANTSLSPPSLPPAATKKKQKLTDQIKAAALSSSTSPPLFSVVSKPKKPSLRALIEAAKSGQVKEETLPSGSAQGLSLLPADSKPKDALKKKTSKPQKVVQSPSTTTHASDFLGAKVNKTSTTPHARGFWEDSEEEVQGLSVNEPFLKPGKITLQDVKSTLGRGNGLRQSGRSSILNQIEATENRKDAVSCSVPLSEHADVKPVKTKASQSKQAALIALQDRPEPTAPTPLLSAPASLPPPAASLSEGLKVGYRMTGLLAASPPLSQSTSHLHFPRVQQTLPARVDGAERLQLEVGERKAAERSPEGVLAQQRLGQVTLRKLPEWMACRTPSRPREVVDMVQRGWQWYYRKYIDVKKGGVAGLGMLLVGYCVMSYIWSYPHIKLDRWRKYH
ncbi:uncharacterized protein LOC103352802 isoform X2 [Stegastes partitus]|uniref:Uncharacterized LOC103352802 n=1 Tax=Stegastes partitus TaxID=144197 RepID=A0A3B4Z590_9TELE|nr:PREDICTED: uncharacterized protein LOC103352802 isoform X2 [Stegastes partitus]